MLNCLFLFLCSKTEKKVTSYDGSPNSSSIYLNRWIICKNKPITSENIITPKNMMKAQTSRSKLFVGFISPNPTVERVVKE